MSGSTDRRARARRVTITDVAHAAGVSIAQASDALNAKGRVAAPTQERVQAAAVRLGYRPSSGARGLATGRTMTLGLRVATGPAIPDAGFFLELLNGASRAAAGFGYGLLITGADLDEAQLVDGLVIVDPVRAADLAGPRSAGLPLVTVGRAPAGADPTPHVDGDHATAVAQLLDHLAECRPRGPVWLLALPEGPSFNRDVTEAFVAWCAAAGREARVVSCANTQADVTRASEAALAGAPPPAILCSVLDRQAAWAQRTLQRSGLRIPEDVAVGSATDGDAAGLSEPPITAYDAAGARVGAAAIELLRAHIDGDATDADRVAITGELRIRASSRRSPVR